MTATATRIIAGVRVSAHCSAEFLPLADDALTTVERIAALDQLHSDTRIRFGWSMLILRADLDGGLTVYEPDFDADPFHDVRPSLDTTLDVVSRQAAVIHQAGVSAVDATFGQMAVVGRDALTSPTLHMFRVEPGAADDSGWSLFTPDSQATDDPDAFDAIPTYRLLKSRPATIWPLALPPTFGVVIEGNRIVSVLRPH